VVVLSGSQERENIKRALELGADHYQPKYADSRKRLELVRLLEQYLTSGSKSKA
jgi:DNA-binding NarL/FixJ family response regulator